MEKSKKAYGKMANIKNQNSDLKKKTNQLNQNKSINFKKRV